MKEEDLKPDVPEHVRAMRTSEMIIMLTDTDLLMERLFGEVEYPEDRDERFERAIDTLTDEIDRRIPVPSPESVHFKLSDHACRACGQHHLLGAFCPGTKVRPVVARIVDGVPIPIGTDGDVVEWSQLGGSLRYRVAFPHESTVVRGNYLPCELQVPAPASASSLLDNVAGSIVDKAASIDAALANVGHDSFVEVIAGSLPEPEREHFEEMRFVECYACSVKPGAPGLCRGCLANRETISRLRALAGLDGGWLSVPDIDLKIFRLSTLHNRAHEVFGAKRVSGGWRVVCASCGRLGLRLYQDEATAQNFANMLMDVARAANAKDVSE